MGEEERIWGENLCLPVQKKKKSLKFIESFFRVEWSEEDLILFHKTAHHDYNISCN